MSLYIDRKYLMLVSPRLERFKQKSEYLWNCRCKVCGDSQKNKLKARGYFYKKKSNIFYSCHNCGASLSLGNFIKSLDPALYRDYQLERYKNENSSNVAKPDFDWAKQKPKFSEKTPTSQMINLPTVSSLPENHVAKQYLLNRKFTKEMMERVYYASDYKSFILELLPTYEKTLYKEERIVFPFYSQDKELLGVQGRSLDKEAKVKYITVKMHDDNQKLFGLDQLDTTKRVYVVEGPIDSMFLKNAVATMDASLYNIIPLLGDLDYVFVYDNQPRNKEVVKHMKKTIDMGKNIFFWPENVTEKDINDWIMTGATSSEIQSYIDTNTFEGLKAQMEFERWKRV